MHAEKTSHISSRQFFNTHWTILSVLCFFVYHGYVKGLKFKISDSRADLEVIHKILNISETVQIPVPRPNVLLFLMMRDVK